MFDLHFEDRVKKLLSKYPDNKIDEKTGQNFWQGYKKIPKPLIFDSSDEFCLKLIGYTTILFC